MTGPRRRLIAPPRLRTLADAEQERHASSLELFFDLVLVVAVRAILIGLYIRAYFAEPLARPLSSRYVAGFSIGAVLWLVSIAVPPPGRFALWGAAVVAELATPLLSGTAVRRVPFSASHVPERLALFTIIVLGEAVLLAITGVGVHIAGTEAVVAALGFLVAACLWWSYFELVDDAPLQRGLVAWQTYLYAHLALFAGITAAGVGVQLATRAAHHSGLNAGARWALCGGPAAFYLALGTMTMATLAGRSPEVWSRLAAGAVAAALAAFAGGLAPLALETLLLAALVAQVAFETAQPPRSKK